MSAPWHLTAAEMDAAWNALAAENAALRSRLAEANAAFEAEQTEKWKLAGKLAEAEALLNVVESTFTDLINTLDHDEDCPWWDEVRDTPEKENWPACGCWKRGAEIIRSNVQEFLSGQLDAFLAPDSAEPTQPYVKDLRARLAEAEVRIRNALDALNDDDEAGAHLILYEWSRKYDASDSAEAAMDGTCDKCGGTGYFVAPRSATAAPWTAGLLGYPCQQCGETLTADHSCKADQPPVVVK